MRSAKPFHTAGPQYQNLVDGIEQRGALRDQDHRHATLLRLFHAVGQRLLADGIQVGVRLVEDDEGGISEESTRQCDALLLSPGKRDPVTFEDGFVSGAKLANHVVHAGNCRSIVDVLVRQVGAEPANVLFYGARKQLDLLRQIAGKFTELPTIPVAQFRSIEADFFRRSETGNRQGPAQELIFPIPMGRQWRETLLERVQSLVR